MPTQFQLTQAATFVVVMNISVNVTPDPTIAKFSSFLACTRLLHYIDVTHDSYISHIHAVFFSAKSELLFSAEECLNPK
jgi:hypothetical protein